MRWSYSRCSGQTWQNNARFILILVSGSDTVKAIEVLVCWAFLLLNNKRDDVIVLESRFLLPPGKLSVFVGVALWGDAENPDS